MSRPTIGCVANVFNEANALPGWLETHLPLFDDVRLFHTGPCGVASDDGTMDIIKKWRVPIDYGDIGEGFGAIRTKAVRSSPCDYVVLLDADERLFGLMQRLDCTGSSTPPAEVDRILRHYDIRDGSVPDWDVIGTLGAGLNVDTYDAYDQMEWLQEMVESRPDAVACVRRHWHDLAMMRPTQNWKTEPDWQMRILRNDSSIHFDAGTKMHERLVGAHIVQYGDFERGPFFDHFHFHFKRMEPEQRRHDVQIYDSIHEGRTPPERPR